MAFQFESRVRYSEMGLDKRLTLASLVNYFQDCSTFQSEGCGWGIDALQARDRAWMVLSWQIEILRRPQLCEKIVVETWPHAFKAFFGHRNFALKDASGEYLAKANSLWVMVDMKTGHPAKVIPELISDYVLEPKLEMPEFSRKIKVPEGGVAQEAFPVVRSNIDTNGHVNNGQYIAMAQEYLPDGFEPSLLRVEYRQQARLHDVIVPIVHEADGEITVSLCGANGDPQDLVYAVIVFAGDRQIRGREEI